MGSGALVLVWSHPTCFGVIRVSFLKIGVTFSYGLGIRQMIYPRTSTENVTSDSPQLSPKGRHNTRDAAARVKIRFSPALAQGATQHEGRSGASQNPILPSSRPRGDTTRGTQRRESKGGRERQKGGMQHEDFPGGHPS